jgi:hypothetical protein
MSYYSWMSASSSVGVLLVVESLVILAVGVALLRRVSRHADEADRRFAELAVRLRLVESRLERLATQAEAHHPEARPATARNESNSPSQVPDRPAVPPEHPREEPPTLISVPDLSLESGPCDSEAREALALRHAEVWRLADTGLAADEISRRTGQPMGEVEVVLGLYRQLHSAQGAVTHVPSH